ncbi:MAG: PleD family two-component system response regulator [Alphaproteobacteria bacterium]
MSARVLVVDDILPNVKLLEAKLVSEYYDVLTATNGKEALEKVASASPDLVLLDVMMPGMDGFEVCRIIKQNPATAHIPVVMVTALTDSEDKVRGLEAGADDFLSKPINDIALMARVRSLVRLKMALDEWRTRENTASQLGVVDKSSNVMSEAVDEARVLIVEDREYEQRKIQETLARDHDSITIALTGIEAAEITAAKDFDVLIISLNLSGEDGLRLCSHLKSNEKTRAVPIVMIGEDEDMPRIAHGLEIGAHDYILRPIDRNELLARVRTQVRRKRFQERLRATYEISLSMALTDSLTGLYNRRYLEVHLQKMLQKSHESRKPLGILMMDIDHFKKVNDTYGHPVGDEVLKIFAARLQDKLRSFDLVARTGGEEFVVILPDVTKKRAQQIAERLRSSIADEPFICGVPEGKISITASIGGAFIAPADKQHEPNNILARADKCLYDAKEGGRNCVVFDGEGKLDPAAFRETERKTIE